MSVESLLPPGTIGGYSGGVWKGFPVDGIRNGVVPGFCREWDFGTLKPSSNINAAEAYWDQGLRAFGSDGASLTYFAGVGYDNGMTLASDGDNEAISLRDQAVQCRISRADAMFAWETVFETDTITDTKNGFFMGLMDNTAATVAIPIINTGAIADVNLVGFHRLEGDGDKLDLIYKANGVTQVTVLADAVTLVAGTEYRVGMTYRKEQDPFTESRYVFRWWLNGVNIVTGTSYKVIPSADGTDFPNDVAMGSIWSLMNATGTTPGGLILKRARYGQVFI